MAVGLGGKLSLLPVIGEVKENYPAYLAGIKAGDRILSINDEEIKTWEELDSIILSSSGELLISIERAPSQIFNLHLTPIEKEAKNIFGEDITRRVIGIASANAVGKVSYRGWESIRYGFEETLKASTLIAQGIVKLISGVVPSSEVGGVVSIVSVIGSASQEGWVILFWLTALISVNLGILNLLPIPALDGGHIIFNCYEIIMRKPPSENVAYYLTLCGWAILLALMFLGLYNDIFRLLS